MAGSTENIFTEELDDKLVKALRNRVNANIFEGWDKNTSILYRNGKMPWVRLQSSVDFNFDPAGNGQKSDQAKRWTLRSLFEKKGAGLDVYEQRNDLSFYNYNSEYGYRALPGIDSVIVRTLQPLGSLREATISFKCWTIGQLEILERLYMRPGYSCLLDWGWSYYLNDFGELSVLNEDFLIDFTDTKTYKTEQSILDALEKNKRRTNFHYDGMLGFVKNFNWKLRNDGGYDCTTTLISKGQLISSMNVNVSSHAISRDSIKSVAESSTFKKTKAGLFSFKALTNANSHDIKPDDGDVPTGIPPKGDATIEADQITYGWMLNHQYSKSVLSGVFYELAAMSDINDTKSGIDYQKFEAYNNVFKQGSGIVVISMKLKNNYTTDISIKEGSIMNYPFGSNDEKKFIYLDDLIRIVNSYGILHYTSGTAPTPAPIFKINNTSIDAKYHPLVISSDYDVCFVKPSNDVINSILNLSNADAEVKQRINKFKNYLNGNFGPGQKYQMFNYKKSATRANASKIMINLHFLYELINSSVLENESNEKDKSVNLTSFMQSVLGEVSAKLGGINNFQLVFDDVKGICKIVDTSLLVDLTRTPKGSKKTLLQKADELKLPVYGRESIVKNLNIESRIFAEQATMISIAAQAGGGTQYGVDSTVMGLYNDGMSDRFFTRKDHKLNLTKSTKKNILEDKEEEYEKLTQAGSNYVDYFLKNIPGAQSTYETKGKLGDSYLGSLMRFVESRNTSDMAAKTSKILPVNLNFTLDGISGFLIGNIINIENNVIPQPFASKIIREKVLTDTEKEVYFNQYLREVDYYFAVTGIEHTINQQGWNTGIKTNFVLHNKGSNTNNKNIQNNVITQLNKVFSGDIVILGFGATTFDKYVKQAINNNNVGAKPEINARILLFAELLKGYDTVSGNPAFNKFFVCALIGNCMHESSLDPELNEYGGGPGYGLIQFTFERGLRTPLMGAPGEDFPLDRGYIGKRGVIYGNINPITKPAEFKDSVNVLNDHMFNTFQFDISITGLLEVVAKSEEIFLKHAGSFGKFGFADIRTLKQFITQVEYIYIQFKNRNTYSGINPQAISNTLDLPGACDLVLNKMLRPLNPALSQVKRFDNSVEVRNLLNANPQIGYTF
jgi:hypothetical protein